MITRGLPHVHRFVASGWAEGDLSVPRLPGVSPQQERRGKVLRGPLSAIRAKLWTHPATRLQTFTARGSRGSFFLVRLARHGGCGRGTDERGARRMSIEAVSYTHLRAHETD